MQSCSKEKTYDKEKAIPAFLDSNQLEIDESLQSVEIAIPNQIQTSNFNVNSIKQNQEIENYFFIAQKNKKGKFLTKSKNLWSGYRSFHKNRSVFEPVIKNGKIYTLDSRGILWCYQLENKKKIFKKRIFARKFLKNYQNPKIGFHNNIIYAISGNNEIVAAKSENGEILWRKTILSLPISKPISDGKNVFITTNDNKTYALNASNGELSWVSSGINRPTAIFGSAKPIIYENKIIVSYSSGEIYALDKENGEQIWSNSLNQSRAVNSDFYLNDIDATPIVKNNTVFAIGNGGLMMAINIENGEYIWKKEIASIADFWAVSDFLFVIDNNAKLIAIQQKDGKIKYIKELAEYKNPKKLQTKIIYNGVMMIGDKLLISNFDGEILIANPQNGEILQTYKIGNKINHLPIVIDSKLYIHKTSRFTTNLVEIW